MERSLAAPASSITAWPFTHHPGASAEACRAHHPRRRRTSHGAGAVAHAHVERVAPALVHHREQSFAPRGELIEVPLLRLGEDRGQCAPAVAVESSAADVEHEIVPSRVVVAVRPPLLAHALDVIDDGAAPTGVRHGIAEEPVVLGARARRIRTCGEQPLDLCALGDLLVGVSVRRQDVGVEGAAEPERLPHGAPEAEIVHAEPVANGDLEQTAGHSPRRAVEPEGPGDARHRRVTQQPELERMLGDGAVGALACRRDARANRT